METTSDPIVHVVLTEAEAKELYQFTLYSYLSPVMYPALTRLLDRVARVVKAGTEEFQ